MSDTETETEELGTGEQHSESLVGTRVAHGFEEQGLRHGTIIDDSRDRDGLVAVGWDESLSVDDRVWSMDPSELDLPGKFVSQTKGNHA